MVMCIFIHELHAVCKNLYIGGGGQAGGVPGGREETGNEN
jgi:hypothetical protein